TFDPANLDEFHPDHKAVGNAVYDTILHSSLIDLYVDELWFFNALEPNLFVDVGSVSKDKLKSLEIHVSQHHEFPGGWEEKKSIILKVMEIQGSPANVKYAESFRRILMRAQD